MTSDDVVIEDAMYGNRLKAIATFVVPASGDADGVGVAIVPDTNTNPETHVMFRFIETYKGEWMTLDTCPLNPSRMIAFSICLLRATEWLSTSGKQYR